MTVESPNIYDLIYFLKTDCYARFLRSRSNIWCEFFDIYSISCFIDITVSRNNNKKMLKSLGNTVCPFEIWNSYGENAVRFYLLSCPATENFNFSESELVRKWNELADIWGNLISRVLNLVEKCGVDDDKSKRSAVDGSKVRSALERRNPCAAIEEILALARSVNKDIEERKPWATKNADDIFQFYYQICEINELFEPLIPSKYAQTCEALKSKKKAILFPKLWQST